MVISTNGEIKGMGKEFIYVENPLDQVLVTEGQTKLADDFKGKLKNTEKLDK